ncbi:MAG: hypothetical protein JO001_06725 [Alphaproteobacteria bacterium]|nr:hypothetical protein [Alphaproteobacteria bacterium]
MYLSSNQELYDYLVRLAQRLKERRATELSEAITGASRQAASTSAEFLGESKIALQRALAEGKAVLDTSEQADLEDVLRQLTAAINRWPQKER